MCGVVGGGRFFLTLVCRVLGSVDGAHSLDNIRGNTVETRKDSLMIEIFTNINIKSRSRSSVDDGTASSMFDCLSNSSQSTQMAAHHVPGFLWKELFPWERRCFLGEGALSWGMSCFLERDQFLGEELFPGGCDRSPAFFLEEMLFSWGMSFSPRAGVFEALSPSTA